MRNALSAEMGKVLNEKIGSSDDVVVKGFSEYTGKFERKIVDDLSALSARWIEPNGAPKDAYFDRPCTITSVTFKTIKISGIDPSKIVTFKAWNKDANTVRVLGALESSALNTVETFAVSWAIQAGEYLMVDGNIACTSPTGDVTNTYKVTYDSETGVVTSYNQNYKHKIGLHYTFTSEYENVPSIVALNERIESPAFFEGERNFAIHTVGSVSSTAGKDEILQFSKDAKVDRDCILWSVKVNKSTAGTSKVYAFNLSTMKRRLLASFTPIQAGQYEIIVNQPVYKDEYVAVTCVPIGAVSGAAYAYTVDENDNILTLSAGGRTEGSLYTFLLPYSPLDVLNRSMYGTMVNQGSSIAVFGGSFSINGTRWMDPIYNRIIQPKVKTHYGVGGCGYINGTTPVPTQIDNAIASGVMYDLWILWASTNDCGQPVGSPTDAAGTTSQAAAMRLCINKIYAYNPYAKIVVFGSARAFSQSKFNEQNGQLHQLVQGQKAFCEYWDIPYLDQWSGLGISSLNYARYFNSDSLHWNDRGYELACHRQAQFLMNLV